MIEAQDITLRIGGKSLLDRVSLTCRPGTVTALVGPNGAGKSTLLSVIAGDLMPDKGHVRLNGKLMSDLKVHDLAQLRAVFPQGSAIRFAYPVREVVSMGRAFRDLSPDGDDRAIDAAMSQAEIMHLSWRDAQTLSGGEQARTTFARVLAQDCSIVLLDEPTAPLDLRHQERVLQASVDLARRGVTVLAVLHDLNLAAAHADRIVLMRNAGIAAEGSPSEVLTEARIEEVYRQQVCVITHPKRGCPVVLTTA
ncbi:heme ABC transporter ATP-binding protein [Paracoccus sp. TK19116]|uniref:Heme ABC transporter ATP-binding protein n=1 Tax=Paracoccus albicereus TaxID=2922394 RepID=A0ABT1MUE1_9RHOB|nr:heme ABC transporter ATP-binding protein [Paracoccus albicereus]MCQ0971954.1 heme ABC transporter ATP-binding protein [Paracoccus albicereus]